MHAYCYDAAHGGFHEAPRNDWWVGVGADAGLDKSIDNTSAIPFGVTVPGVFGVHLLTHCITNYAPCRSIDPLAFGGAIQRPTPKTINTHLHLLEAVAAFDRALVQGQGGGDGGSGWGGKRALREQGGGDGGSGGDGKRALLRTVEEVLRGLLDLVTGRVIVEPQGTEIELACIILYLHLSKNLNNTTRNIKQARSSNSTTRTGAGLLYPRIRLSMGAAATVIVVAVVMIRRGMLLGGGRRRRGIGGRTPLSLGT